MPFETVRFAAANHLCVDLSYGDDVREIEPYSLRRTRDGCLLLYRPRVADGEIRSYRVDHITSVTVMSTPFRPRYRVKLTATGNLSAPPVVSKPRRGAVSGRAASPRRLRRGGYRRGNEVVCQWRRDYGP